MIRERMEQLRQRMKQEKIDLYYIPTADFHQSEYVGEYFKCREYMSGFTGSAGSLVVTREEACLFTDGRYHIQAEQELKNSGIHLFRWGEMNIPSEEEYIEVYMQKHNTFGFDGRVVSAAFVERLLKKAKLPKTAVIYQKDLVNEIWNTRPDISKEKIYQLEPWQTGESAADKIKRIRSEMKRQGAQAHVIASLDDIAWIFNLRGNDVKHNPVFLAFALITEDTACLYLAGEAITESVKEYLKENKIKWKNYNDIYRDVALFGADYTILLDKETINYCLLQSISKDESPYPYLYKTMKVYTEVLGYSPDRAAETASDMYYEGKAFTWYGREHGFTVSDDEVKSYINSIVSDYTNADNYEELQAACSANGTTLEEVAFDNFYTYKVQLLRDRIYEAEQENHPEFDTRESFNEYWNDFKARIVEDYKSSDEFQSVQKACKNSITLINSDVGADKSVLSKHEIFIE